MTEIRLIASDIDGTFLNDQREFDRSRFQAQLDELSRRQIKFVVASGNQLAHCQEVFEGIEGDLTFVAEDGALTVEQGKVLDDNPIKPALLRDALDYLMSTPEFAEAKLILSTRQQAFTNMVPSDADWKDSAYFYQHLTPVAKLTAVNEPIYKIDIHWSGLTDVRPQAEQLQNALGDDLGCVMSGLGGMDVTMPHVTKAYGLAQLQNLWQISMDETMAFGDTQNDEAMLQHARLGYAMKNAEPEAKKATKLITKLDNNHSGVLDMIERLLAGEIK